MPYIRIVRVDRHGLAQKVSAFLVLPAHAVEIGEIDERGRKVRIEAQGRPVVVLRLHWVTELCLDQAEVQMRLRPLGIDHLGLEQFKDGGGESGLLLQRERVLVDARERSRRFDADRADRITQQRRHGFHHRERRRRWQRARHGGADKWV